MSDDALESLTPVRVNTLQACNEIETLIDSHVVPHEVLLVADTEELANFTEFQIIDLCSHDLWQARCDWNLHGHHAESR